eukprot:TRINITY_DN12075_c0_g1_i14.p4 TRINITY_DN12075_c0_g1~~TRINITY_DN12075_c0_g1_i14.p4  ORF type:complete len:122 (-),score=16.54 TRINITY_DN12075_c0_g1_i14:119-484(-)
MSKPKTGVSRQQELRPSLHDKLWLTREQRQKLPAMRVPSFGTEEDVSGKQRIGVQRAAGQSGYFRVKPRTLLNFAPIDLQLSHRASVAHRSHSSMAVGRPPSMREIRALRELSVSVQGYTV